MSIGASILNTELSRPHDRFMVQIRAAWKMIRRQREADHKEEISLSDKCVSDAEKANTGDKR